MSILRATSGRRNLGSSTSDLLLENSADCVLVQYVGAFPMSIVDQCEVVMFPAVGIRGAERFGIAGPAGGCLGAPIALWSSWQAQQELKQSPIDSMPSGTHRT